MSSNLRSPGRSRRRDARPAARDGNSRSSIERAQTARATSAVVRGIRRSRAASSSSMRACSHRGTTCFDTARRPMSATHRLRERSHRSARALSRRCARTRPNAQERRGMHRRNERGGHALRSSEPRRSRIGGTCHTLWGSFGDSSRRSNSRQRDHRKNRRRGTAGSFPSRSRWPAARARGTPGSQRCRSREDALRRRAHRA